MDEPVDPDVDLHVKTDVVETAPSPWPVLAAVSTGGVCGAIGRYLLGTAWPHPPAGFAWSTFTINVTGCFLIGILMVLVTHVYAHRRLLRPFLGTGVLGGYTTFSTYIVDVQHAAPATALLYLATTLVCALLAVWAGHALTSRMIS